MIKGKVEAPAKILWKELEMRWYKMKKTKRELN